MTEFLFIILQVIILDGILSIDNAAALGAISSSLPDNKPAPLPKWLNWLGANQQQAALKAGILGAYVGRGLMLLIVGVVISYPILKLVGAAYLLYLVFKHFYPSQEAEDNRFNHGAGNFWKTVLMIELADLAFSIDNVVAVVALSSHIWIIIFGVCLSIIIMRFAAIIFIKMLKFEPLLEHAAYVLILAIGIELILKYLGVEIGELTQFTISMLILAIIIIYGQIERRIYGRTN
jgi:tellurite resistance protein TerC